MRSVVTLLGVRGQRSAERDKFPNVANSFAKITVAGQIKIKTCAFSDKSKFNLRNFMQMGKVRGPEN